MARKTLTDRLLRTLKADTADAVVPGLAVRIGAAGQKTFVLIGRYPGRRNPTRRAVGVYPGDLTGTGPRHRARLDCPDPTRHRSCGPSRDRAGSKPRSRSPTPSGLSPNPFWKSTLPAGALQPLSADWSGAS